MNCSNEEIIEIAEDWWGISRPNLDEDGKRRILHDGSLRSDLAEQLLDVGGFSSDEEEEDSPDSEDIECVARVIEHLVECHLEGDDNPTDLNAVINHITVMDDEGRNFLKRHVAKRLGL